MKILFLGSSHGRPEKGAFCSSTAVLVNNKVFLVDIGAPAYSLMKHKGIDIDNLRAVFITHIHGDHTNGIFELADQITWAQKTSDPTIYMPEQLGINLIKSWISYVDDQPERVKFQVYREGTVYDDGEVKVSAFKTMHMRNSHGFLFEAEGKRVLFTGDMGHQYPEYEEITKDGNYDVVIAEGAHHNPGNATPIYANTDTKHLIVNHLAPSKEEGFKPLFDSDKFKFSFAKDGMEIKL